MLIFTASTKPCFATGYQVQIPRLDQLIGGWHEICMMLSAADGVLVKHHTEQIESSSKAQAAILDHPRCWSIPPPDFGGGGGGGGGSSGHLQPTSPRTPSRHSSRVFHAGPSPQVRHRQRMSFGETSASARLQRLLHPEPLTVKPGRHIRTFSTSPWNTHRLSLLCPMVPATLMSTRPLTDWQISLCSG